MFLSYKIKKIRDVLARIYTEKWQSAMITIAQKRGINGMVRYGKVVTRADLDRHFFE